ncbi:MULTISPECIES: MFS transporter [unclassified Dehalobacter]|uniref:MFS transporter n=1 Tax=unclassified Dehalobacter TaxID=2635733 RepID=UPI00249EE0C9|nr:MULTISPECIES: MFS transporter [unclassified Dehalobacter]
MSTVNVLKTIGQSKMNKFFVIVAVLAFLGLLFDGYAQGVYSTSLPSLIQDTGIEPTVFGLIGSYTLYGMIAGGIIFGMLVDKIGNKKVFMLAIGFYAMFTGLMGTATTVWQFSLYQVLTGMGAAGIAPVTFAMLAEYSPLKNRIQLINTTTLGMPLGRMLSTLAGMAILPSFGWRPMFLIGFIPLILIVFCIFYLPESMQKLIKDDKREKIQKILKLVAPEYILA